MIRQGDVEAVVDADRTSPGNAQRARRVDAVIVFREQRMPTVIRWTYRPFTVTFDHGQEMRKERDAAGATTAKRDGTG